MYLALQSRLPLDESVSRGHEESEEKGENAHATSAMASAAPVRETLLAACESFESTDALASVSGDSARRVWTTGRAKTALRERRGQMGRCCCVEKLA